MLKRLGIKGLKNNCLRYPDKKYYFVMTPLYIVPLKVFTLFR